MNISTKFFKNFLIIVLTFLIIVLEFIKLSNLNINNVQLTSNFIYKVTSIFEYSFVLLFIQISLSLIIYIYFFPKEISFNLTTPRKK